MINESYFSLGRHPVAFLLLISTAFILPSADAATKINGRSGATIFTLMCAECHTTGISGAPKISDKAAWTLRLKQEPDTLVQHALHGYKLMPSRGSCSSCSDAEIKAAVEYMIEKAK
ncbi:c-type cytochrome [Undibacterium sp. SXout20W]|uniref:c-type cytochrome n=1 Tax=Undibacterium sp. SXout20W TaxID=3413051 RepID=UPI003BF38CB2